MTGNPIQFAVVREDPSIEAELVRSARAQRALLIASGGCTALALQSLFPTLAITILDPNGAQLALVRRKIAALGESAAFEHKALLNVGTDSPAGLNACGNFEALFRGLRNLIHEFVLSREEWERFFAGRVDSGPLLESVFTNRYWPLAFELFFSDAFLLAMFGPEAVQHAPPGSYPRYFQAALERGLRSPSAPQNYFLHHILLGHYLDRADCLPQYLLQPAPSHPFEFVQGTAEHAPDLESFDVVSFSNIFDWMPEAGAQRVLAQASKHMKKGAYLVYRQLNHSKNFERHLGDAFTLETNLAERLLAADRSLFYSKLVIARKS